MGDLSSALFRQVMQVFGVTHPIRVGIGICGGFAAKLLFAVGLAYYPGSPLLQTLNGFAAFYYCFIIVGLLMLPTAFGRRGAPEQVAHQIRGIEALLEAGRLSRAQQSMIWHSLIQKYLNALKPDLTQPPSIKILDEARNEIAAKSDPSQESL